jgi:MFS family permease
MPHMPTFWWLLLPVFLFGVAQGLNYPNLMTLLTALAPLEQRAAVMAVNGMVLRLSQTIAPLAVTSIYAVSGFSGVYAFGGATAVVMFIITAHSIR